eukprot:365258-Chlamydomonas_euryale.AAC.1
MPLPIHTYQAPHQRMPLPIHMYQAPHQCTPQADALLWAAVLELREAVNGALERARADKAVGASLDARVMLYVADEGLRARLRGVDVHGMLCATQGGACGHLYDVFALGEEG